IAPRAEDVPPDGPEDQGAQYGLDGDRGFPFPARTGHSRGLRFGSVGRSLGRVEAVESPSRAGASREMTHSAYRPVGALTRGSTRPSFPPRPWERKLPSARDNARPAYRPQPARASTAMIRPTVPGDTPDLLAIARETGVFKPIELV